MTQSGRGPGNQSLKATRNAQDPRSAWFQRLLEAFSYRGRTGRVPRHGAAVVTSPNRNSKPATVELDGKALGRTMVGKRPGKDPVGSAGILIVHANVTNVPDVAVFMTILMGLR